MEHEETTAEHRIRARGPDTVSFAGIPPTEQQAEVKRRVPRLTWTKSASNGLLTGWRQGSRVIDVETDGHVTVYLQTGGRVEARNLTAALLDTRAAAVLR